MTDAYAKSRGFRSRFQYEEFNKKGPNLMGHAKAWTADDFAYFRQAIAADSDKPALFAVLALGRLVRIDQCRQGLAIFGRRAARSAGQKAAWFDAIARWNTNSTKRLLVTEVMEGDNTDLAEIAREVAKVEKTPQ